MAMAGAPARESSTASAELSRFRRRLARVLAVARHEWRLRMYAPLTYVFMAGFLLALAACIFLVSDFPNSDEASIRLLVVFLPWVALILVPALVMRAFADEPGDRSLELALSLPPGLGAVVAGKFLAGAAVLLLMLAGTLPFALTVAWLGEPDRGALVAGYLGAAMLLPAYLAVALLAAALAREPVGAYVLGVLALFALTLAGSELVGPRGGGSLAGRLADHAGALSPRAWLERFATGRLDLSGLLTLGLTGAAALGGAAWIVDARRRPAAGVAGWLRGTAWAAAAFAAVLVTGAVARRIPLAIDLTDGREHTLHRGTLEIVDRLPAAGVDVVLYWSRQESSVPPAIRAHARRIEELLGSLAARSRGRIRLTVRDPAPDTDAELDAAAAGIRRVPLSAGGSFFLGAALRHGARQDRVAYLDIRRDGLLEYDVARALAAITRARTPKVGLLTPLLTPSQLGGGREGLSILADLKRGFDVAVVPHFASELPAGLDLVVAMDATILRREMLYALDQHVMAGGGLVVLLDPKLRTNPASDRVRPEPSEAVDDISDLLLKWGLRYRSGQVVGDETFAAPVVDSSQRQLAYPFWLRVGEPGLSRQHAVTASINELLLAEAGSFDLVDPPRASPLITTTAKSGVLAGATFAGRTPEAAAAAFRSDGRGRVVAAALEGPFASAFAGPPEGVAAGRPHRSRSEGRPAVFAVADIDWLFDDFAVQTLDVGGRAATRPLNDNHAFFLNMIEFASGDPALIAIRSRGRLARPFTRVAALVRDGQQRYRAQEAEIAGRIAKVEQQIARIPQVAGVERLEQLPGDIQERVRQLQRDLAPERKRLRAIRLGMREEVEALLRRLTILNLMAGPLLAVGLGLLLRHLRRRRLMPIKADPGR